MHTKGFTLIELLVIILIIGVLAAIALPQYQAAVSHSRFSQLQITASSLRSAAQRYRLATSKWPSDFSTLDVGFAGEITDNGTVITLKDCRCEYYEDTDDINPLLACYTLKGPTVGYLISYANDEKYCMASSAEDKARAFCETLGGESMSSSYLDGMDQYTVP